MRELLVERIGLWLSDPESSVEYAEEVEGRWAVRMSQQSRDATTVWFTVGERSLSYEAYVLPLPPDSAAAYRQALFRNGRSWRAFFALDADNSLVLRGRIPAEHLSLDELDLVLGEIHETVEVAFPPLLRDVYGDREKSG